MRNDLTQDYLKSILDYDHSTGVFIWKYRNDIPGRGGKIWNTKYPGKKAGCLRTTDGYFSIGINNKMYMSHRLAWLIIHGTWPKDQIDHINGIRTDNRLINLREANTSENGQNHRNASSNNKLGILGVCWYKKKFVASIGLNGKYKYLGFFNTAEEAHAAYIQAKIELHPFGQLR